MEENEKKGPKSLVMELIEGKTLEDLRKEKGLTAQKALGECATPDETFAITRVPSKALVNFRKADVRAIGA